MTSTQQRVGKVMKHWGYGGGIKQTAVSAKGTALNIDNMKSHTDRKEKPSPDKLKEIIERQYPTKLHMTPSTYADFVFRYGKEWAERYCEEDKPSAGGEGGNPIAVMKGVGNSINTGISHIPSFPYCPTCKTTNTCEVTKQGVFHGTRKPSGQELLCKKHNVAKSFPEDNRECMECGLERLNQPPQPKSFFDMTDEEKKIIVDRAAKESTAEQIRKYGNPTQPPLQGKQDKWFCTRHQLNHGQKYKSCIERKPKQDWEERYDNMTEENCYRSVFNDDCKCNQLKSFIRHSIQIAVEEKLNELRNKLIKHKEKYQDADYYDIIGYIFGSINSPQKP